MSELGLLHERLQGLVHGRVEVAGGVRVLDVSGTGGVAGAFLREVTETQLLRSVTFTNDRRERLTLDVAAGRVVRLAQPTSNALLPAEADRAALEQGVDRATQAALSACVEGVLGEAAALTVSTRLSRKPVPSGLLGVPPEVLMPHRSEAETLGQDHVRTFVEACADRALAGLCLSEAGVLTAFGTDAQLADLQRLADVIGTEKAQGDATAPSCVVYSGHPDVGVSLVCAAAGEALGLVRLETTQTAAILPLWTSEAA